MGFKVQITPFQACKMMPRVFCDANIDDVASECTQIIQIVDDATGICYELLKQDNNNILVHYTSSAYVLKQYVNADIILEDAIDALGLSVDNFRLYLEYGEHSLEDMLKTRVANLPLLSGHVLCPRCG